MLCYKCNSQIPDYSLVCTKCGAEMSVKARQRACMGAESGTIPTILPQSMLWFTILVSFYLFFDAISSVFTAAEYMFGPFKFLSETGVEEFIATFSDLNAGYKIIDIIYGGFFIIFAVMAVIVRNKLAKFKKKAPVYFLLYLIIPTAVSLIYTVALLIVSKTFDATQFLSIVMQTAIQGAIVYANYIYFKKRKHLFKN